MGDLLNEEIMALWDSAMSDNNISLLQKNIDQIIETITDGIFKRQYKALNCLFQEGTKKIEAWGNRLEINTLEDFKIVAYAIFWMAEKMSNDLYNYALIEEEKNKKYEKVKTLQRSKYLYSVLSLLERNGELPSKAIAENLSISTSTLSDFLHRNCQYGLWEYKKHGEYNYYRLTSQGRDYLELLQRQNIQKNDNINDILSFFMQCLTDELEQNIPSAENIIHKMNQEFGDTQPIFGNVGDKIELSKTIRKFDYIFKYQKRKTLIYSCKRSYETYDLDENSYYLLDDSNEYEINKEYLF